MFTWICSKSYCFATISGVWKIAMHDTHILAFYSCLQEWNWDYYLIWQQCNFLLWWTCWSSWTSFPVAVIKSVSVFCLSMSAAVCKNSKAKDDHWCSSFLNEQLCSELASDIYSYKFTAVLSMEENRFLCSKIVFELRYIRSLVSSEKEMT